MESAIPDDEFNIDSWFIDVWILYWILRIRNNFNKNHVILGWKKQKLVV